MFRKNKKPTVETSRRQRQPRADTKQPSAFSYYSRRSDELLSTGRQIARTETAEHARAASRYWRQRFGLAILLVTSLVCLVYVSTLSTQPRVIVQAAASSPAVLQDQQVYAAAATKILTSSILNRNKITVSTNDLASRLTAQFPEIATIQVGLPLLTHRLSLTITNAEPVLILATANGSYALDAGGTALLSGAQLATLSSLNLPLVTDESSIKVSLRHQALTSDNINFILTVIAQLQARKLPLEALTLPGGASELDVRLSGQPYYVKFNLASNSSRQQVGTFLAAYDRLQAAQTTPGQYIDVRVDGRAYYK